MLNRRGFLGTLVAACVAPFLPTPTREPITRCEPLTVSWIQYADGSSGWEYLRRDGTVLRQMRTLT